MAIVYSMIIVGVFMGVAALAIEDTRYDKEGNVSVVLAAIAVALLFIGGSSL